MKVKTLYNKEIKCEYDVDDKKFAIIFNAPSAFDMLNMQMPILGGDMGGFVKAVMPLFERFENKPKLEDNDGKELEYETLQDFADILGAQFFVFGNGIIEQFTIHINGLKNVEKKS